MPRSTEWADSLSVMEKNSLHSCCIPSPTNRYLAGAVWATSGSVGVDAWMVSSRCYTGHGLHHKRRQFFSIGSAICGTAAICPPTTAPARIPPRKVGLGRSAGRLLLSCVVELRANGRSPQSLAQQGPSFDQWTCYIFLLCFT